MRYINLRFILTYLLTYLLTYTGVEVERLFVAGTRSRRRLFVDGEKKQCGRDFREHLQPKLLDYYQRRQREFKVGGMKRRNV